MSHEHDKIVREANRPGMQYGGLNEGTWQTPLLVLFLALVALLLVATALYGLYELAGDLRDLTGGA